MKRFGGLTEPYHFYGGTIELQYEPVKHIYYRIVDGEFVAQDGVTTVCHVIDKSEVLIPWACKKMAEKLLSTMPKGEAGGLTLTQPLRWEDFEKLVLEAKAAHRETLEDAGNVGTAAHNWIEKFIKARLKGTAGVPSKDAFGLMDELPADPRARNCCLAAIDWMVQHDVLWICTEHKIYSRQFVYAGTMDGLARVSSCADPHCCPHPFKHRLTVVDWKSSNYLYLEYLFQTAAYEYAYEEEFGVNVQDRWIIRLGKEDGEFDPWHRESHEFSDDFNGFLNCLKLTRSVRNGQARIKAKYDLIKAERRLEREQAREEALKEKCKGAAKYKGVRAPKCNGGNPCKACLAKYAEVQQAKSSSQSEAAEASTSGT